MGPLASSIGLGWVCAQDDAIKTLANRHRHRDVRR
jgi:hypothetical protein